MEGKQTHFNQEDVYGVLEDNLEIDSDVNEDRNREALLDASLAEFVEVIKKGKLE